MGRYRGYNGQVWYGLESTYGTAVTPDKYFGRITSFTPSMVNEFEKTMGIGDGRTLTAVSVGKFTGTGTINWNVLDGKSLFLILGGGTYDSPPYTPTEDTLPSFTIECGLIGTSDTVDTYKGCVGNRLTISASQGAELKASMEIIFQKPETDTSITAGYAKPTTQAFVFEQGVVKREGSTINFITDFSTTIDNRMTPDENFHLGSRFIVEPIPNPCSITYNITKRYEEDFQMKKDFYGGSSEPIDGLSSSAPTEVEFELYFSADSGARTLTITLTGCSIENYGQDLPSSDAYVDAAGSGFAKTISINHS